MGSSDRWRVRVGEILHRKLEAEAIKVSVATGKLHSPHDVAKAILNIYLNEESKKPAKKQAVRKKKVNHTL